MNKIIFPLNPGDRSDAVADLHDGLALLLKKNLVAAGNEQEQKRLLAVIKRDRVEKLYGDNTVLVVKLGTGPMPTSAWFRKQPHASTSQTKFDYALGMICKLTTQLPRPTIYETAFEPTIRRYTPQNHIGFHKLQLGIGR